MITCADVVYSDQENIRHAWLSTQNSFNLYKLTPGLTWIITLNDVLKSKYMSNVFSPLICKYTYQTLVFFCAYKYHFKRVIKH